MSTACWRSSPIAPAAAPGGAAGTRRHLVDPDGEERHLLAHVVVQLVRDPAPFLLLRLQQPSAQTAERLFDAPVPMALNQQTGDHQELAEQRRHHHEDRMFHGPLCPIAVPAADHCRS